MVPVTLTLQGTPTPVLFTFRKEGQWLLLELQGLPEEAQGLQSSDAIALDKDRRCSPPHLLEAILRTALAQEEVKGSKFHISGREKIRLRNLEIFGLEPLPKAAPTTTAPQPAKWLHEMLCNFANPIEATPKLLAQGSDGGHFSLPGEGFPRECSSRQNGVAAAGLLEEEYVAFSKWSIAYPCKISSIFIIACKSRWRGFKNRSEAGKKPSKPRVLFSKPFLRD